MKEQPNYYAIIPANVRYDKGLRANEKLLYGEITALSNATGECWASNNYFADLYQVTPQAVSGWIRDLKNKGYIDVEIVYKDGTKEIQKRIIKIVSINDCEGINKNLIGINKGLTGINEKLIPINQKFKDNNTSNNIKKNNKNIIYTYTDNSELIEALQDFEKMRKSIKKPLTERAWKIIFSKLDSISPDITIKIAVLNQSIEHSWQSVYPLKENGLKPQITGNERLGWIDDI